MRNVDEVTLSREITARFKESTEERKQRSVLREETDVARLLIKQSEVGTRKKDPNGIILCARLVRVGSSRG